MTNLPEDSVDWDDEQPYNCHFYPARDCPGCIYRCARIGDYLPWERGVPCGENRLTPVVRTTSSTNSADASTYHGAPITNSENSEMGKKSGDSDASNILNTETSESPTQRMMTSAHILRTEQTEPSEIVSSKELGDPTLGEVLQQHIERCVQCAASIQQLPTPFGMPNKRHCQEYFDIIQEYSDYERDYISKGKP
jgi:hypothetical protein